MILRKQKPLKLQLGGGMRLHQFEEYTGNEVSDTLKPLGKVDPNIGLDEAQRSAAASGAGVSPSANMKGALQSDREAITAEIANIKDEIVAGSTQEGFYESSAYKGLANRLRELSTMGVENALSRSQRFSEIRNVSKDKLNDVAILGDNVFVKDQSTGQYGIVDRDSILNTFYTDVNGEKVRKFKPETIATALNQRANNVNFSFITGEGDTLEDIITNVIGSRDLDKRINESFKNTGYSQGKSEVIVEAGGASIPEFLDFLVNSSSKSTKSVSAKSNIQQLEAARQTFISKITPQERNALEDLGWSQYLESGDSETPAEQWVENWMNTYINGSMEKYLKEQYGEKAGSAQTSGSQAKSKTDFSKVKIPTNSLVEAAIISNTDDPTLIENSKLEFKDSKGNNSVFLAKGVKIPEASRVWGSEDSYLEAYSKDDGKEMTVENNSKLTTVVNYEDFIYQDGTSVNTGDEKLVIDKSRPSMILQDMPMRKVNGKWTIAWDIAQYKGDYDKRYQAYKKQMLEQVASSGREVNDADFERVLMKAISDTNSELAKTVNLDGVKLIKVLQIPIVTKEDYLPEGVPKQTKGFDSKEGKHYRKMVDDSDGTWISRPEYVSTNIFAPIPDLRVLTRASGFDTKEKEIGDIYHLHKNLQSGSLVDYDIQQLLTPQ